MLKKLLVRLTLFCFAALAGLFILQVTRLIIFTRKLSYDLTPFARNLADAPLRVLFVGDSTAVGTGAVDNSRSVAGWLGQEYPHAQIVNYGENGKRLSQLARELSPGPEHYRLMVVQIGGNDILRFTPLSDMERDLDKVLENARQMADSVVILHSGNVGAAPVFIWPLDKIYEERTRAVRALYIEKARAAGALYVDLFAERDRDIFLKDVGKYYSPDRLHPSGDGYHWWYERIRATLTASGIPSLRP